MVTEDQYAAVMAENGALRAQGRAALGRIAALEARGGAGSQEDAPPSFVKAGGRAG